MFLGPRNPSGRHQGWGSKTRSRHTCGGVFPRRGPERDWGAPPPRRSTLQYFLRVAAASVARNSADYSRPSWCLIVSACSMVSRSRPSLSARSAYSGNAEGGGASGGGVYLLDGNAEEQTNDAFRARAQYASYRPDPLDLAYAARTISSSK
jgi:hypothetical protein